VHYSKKGFHVVPAKPLKEVTIMDINYFAKYVDKIVRLITTSGNIYEGVVEDIFDELDTET